MRKDDAVTLSYSELRTLIRCGLDSVPDVLDFMRNTFGDTAPMYDAELSLCDSGRPVVAFRNRNAH